ncbi:MAG: hypothetical protein QOJ26_1166 [Thermoplasmata archaeon]|nr:hypothetical protein [Thermoplasmata archaeon]
MDPRDARLVLNEARGWARRGLVAPEAMATIEAEYGATAGREPADADVDQPAVGLSILYALAGALVGAAAIAVPILLKVADAYTPWWLLGIGLPLLAIGLAGWRLGWPAGIVDALLIGSLVPLTILGLPNDTLGRWIPVVSVAAALAVAWLPRPSTTTPVVGHVAVFASVGIACHQMLGPVVDDGTVSWVWLGLGLAQLGSVVGLRSGSPLPWRTVVTALLCVGMVVPFVLGLDHAIPSQPARTYELFVGAFELALLLIGLGLRQRGMVLGASIVVAGDAIVFAFDVNVLLGIVTLLGVAVMLILLATTLRRFVRIGERT